MDIINYTEVDKLEKHLKNRTIQEALLREDTIEWALNYDKENLGKNFAIAYGLNVSEWEQYKSIEDFEKIDSSISGSGNVFVMLGRLNLRFADLFYDKILPHAKVKTLSTFAKTVFIASIILDISPPEAIFESSFSSSPLLVHTINSTLSKPFELNLLFSIFCTFTLNCAFFISKSLSSLFISCQ